MNVNSANAKPKSIENTENTCRTFDISFLRKEENLNKSYKRLNTPYEKGSKLKDKDCRSAITFDEVVEEKMIGFKHQEDIDMMIAYFFEKKAYTNAVLFIFGVNTGFRCGDIVSLRVQNCFDNINGKLVAKDFITLQEEKTEHIRKKKPRTVFLNDIVKKSITWLAEHKNLRWDYNDFMFFADKPQNQYKWKHDPNIICPMEVESVRKFIVKATKDLGIFGHFGSHSMRSTYAYHMGLRKGSDISQYHIDLSTACAALGHSDSRITQQHYLNETLEELRNKNLSFNLGSDAWIAYTE